MFDFSAHQIHPTLHGAASQIHYALLPSPKEKRHPYSIPGHFERPRDRAVLKTTARCSGGARRRPRALCLYISVPPPPQPFCRHGGRRRGPDSTEQSASIGSMPENASAGTADPRARDSGSGREASATPLRVCHEQGPPAELGRPGMSPAQPARRLRAKSEKRRAGPHGDDGRRRARYIPSRSSGATMSSSSAPPAPPP